MKAVLRGKFIALNAYINNLEKFHTSELIEHLKALEQKGANSPRSRCKETIKLRAEIFKAETKRTIQRINKTKSWFFEKINKIDKPLKQRQRENIQINKIRRRDI